RLDQVWGDPGEHQLSFPQRLADQTEIELFQVPQPAVEQLRRPRRGPRREITRLYQRHPQSTSRRVERRTGTGHPAADHQNIKIGPIQRGPCPSALFEPELRITLGHRTLPVVNAYSSQPNEIDLPMTVS